MNKLLLNNRGRNHIRMFPLGNAFESIPTDEGDRIRWAESVFNELRDASKAKRLSLHVNRKKGYLVAVWALEGRCYLIVSIRNEFGTYNNTIYVSREENDMVAIAKFLKENIETAMRDYHNQILEARDALLREKNESKREEHTERD